MNGAGADRMRAAAAGGTNARGHVWSTREVRPKHGSKQDQNLAMTGSCVTSSLDSGNHLHSQHKRLSKIRTTSRQFLEKDPGLVVQISELWTAGADRMRAPAAGGTDARGHVWGVWKGSGCHRSMAPGKHSGLGFYTLCLCRSICIHVCIYVIYIYIFLIYIYKCIDR